jgi:hypothetical protein
VACAVGTDLRVQVVTEYPIAVSSQIRVECAMATEIVVVTFAETAYEVVGRDAMMATCFPATGAHQLALWKWDSLAFVVLAVLTSPIGTVLLAVPVLAMKHSDCALLAGTAHIGHMSVVGRPPETSLPTTVRQQSAAWTGQIG